MGAQSIPVVATLELIRGEIETHRALAPSVDRAALAFGVIHADGRTEYWTIYVEPRGARLERELPPIEYDAPMATVYGTEQALGNVTCGGAVRGIDVDGDIKLFETLAACIGGNDFVGVRGS